MKVAGNRSFVQGGHCPTYRDRRLLDGWLVRNLADFLVAGRDVNNKTVLGGLYAFVVNGYGCRIWSLALAS